MDYKMLHGGGSRAASSPSTAEQGVARSLRSALPEGAFETVDKTEGLLVGVGERAPGALVEPALGALTSGGKRLRPLLLVLCAEMGEPGRGARSRSPPATTSSPRRSRGWRRSGTPGWCVPSRRPPRGSRLENWSS